MSTLKLTLVTATGSGFTKEADVVKVPGIIGEVGVLENHSPSLVKLKPGHVQVKVGKESEYFFIPGGLAHILTDSVAILTSDYEKASEIDLPKAKESKELALRTLQESTEEKELEEAKQTLAESEERIYICEHLQT